MVTFDLDDFKGINDRHGRPAGDAALRGFADTLQAQAHASDLVCRTGGEEFTVTTPPRPTPPPSPTAYSRPHDSSPASATAG